MKSTASPTGAQSFGLGSVGENTAPQFTIQAVLDSLQDVQQSNGSWLAKCPAHDDKSPSLSIGQAQDGKLLLHCFAGCEFDAIRSAMNLSPTPFTPRPRFHTTTGTTHQRERLAALRNVGTWAVEIAVARGLVRFGDWHGQAVWAVTDRDGRNTQLRRLDGKDLSVGQRVRKSHTLKGSKANWPIGILEAGPAPVIALVEGGPDLLAAFARIAFESREDDCAVVAMLGASNRIHQDALLHFEGKRVRIFPDADKAGNKAAGIWCQQLREVGATVDAFSFAGLTKPDGKPIKDFNDFCYADARTLLSIQENLLP
jgi:hypothetical protein